MDSSIARFCFNFYMFGGFLLMDSTVKWVEEQNIKTDLIEKKCHQRWFQVEEKILKLIQFP